MLIRPAIAAAWLVLLSLPAAANCLIPAQASSTLGLVNSRWQEFSPVGSRLVQEDGQLTRIGLQLAGTCSTFVWSMAVQNSVGSRAYDGLSSANAPLITRSDIDWLDWQLELSRPLSAAWSIGARLRYNELRRRIATTGTVLGYPEQLRYMQAAVGTRFTLRPGFGWQLRSELWLGGGPPGSLSVQLPGTDPATLGTGASQWAQLGMYLHGASDNDQQPGWQWGLSYVLERQELQAGAPQALTRAGIPFLTAQQPRAVLSSGALEASLRYHF